MQKIHSLQRTVFWAELLKCQGMATTMKKFAHFLTLQISKNYRVLISTYCHAKILIDIYVGVSVQFSCSVMSDSLRPHGLQQARPPCPSPTPGIYSNSCPLSKWCHPTISSSFIPFASNLQSFPASGSFQMSQLFASSGQSVWSFSFNISPSNEHPGLISFRMNWLDPLGCMHIHFKICTCLFLDFLWIKRLFFLKRKKDWFSFLNEDSFLLVYQGRESHDLLFTMLSTCIENSVLGARKVGVGGKGHKEGSVPSIVN